MSYIQLHTVVCMYVAVCTCGGLGDFWGLLHVLWRVLPWVGRLGDYYIYMWRIHLRGGGDFRGTTACTCLGVGDFGDYCMYLSGCGGLLGDYCMYLSGCGGTFWGLLHVLWRVLSGGERGQNILLIYH